MKTTEQKKKAKKIVDAIINDLNDRSGLGIDNLELDIQQEIREEWTKIVLKAIES